MSSATRDHNAALREVRQVLRQLDSPNAPITPGQHLRAIESHTHTLALELADGLDQPLERFRLARVAAHAIALMTDGSD